jgi:hypothetical protein
MADLARIAPVYRDAALIACHYVGVGLASRMALACSDNDGDLGVLRAATQSVTDKPKAVRAADERLRSEGLQDETYR